MTGKQDQFIPGFYRQHILAGVIIAGKQHGRHRHPRRRDRRRGQPHHRHLRSAAHDHPVRHGRRDRLHPGLARRRATSGSSTASRPRSRSCTGRAASGRRSASEHTATTRRYARYDSASRTAIVRVGSLTWTVQDRAAADSMREAWRYIAELTPIILGRQAPVRRRRKPDPTRPLTGPDLPAPPGAGGVSRHRRLIHTERSIHILAVGLDRIRARRHHRNHQSARPETRQEPSHVHHQHHPRRPRRHRRHDPRCLGGAWPLNSPLNCPTARSPGASPTPPAPSTAAPHSTAAWICSTIAVDELSTRSTTNCTGPPTEDHTPPVNNNERHSEFTIRSLGSCCGQSRSPRSSTLAEHDDVQTATP